MAGSNCRPARYECAALPTELIEHDRVFYAGHPLSEKPTRIQHHSAATPIDSVLYPLPVFRSYSRLTPGLSNTFRHSTCLSIIFEAVSSTFGQRTTSGPCSPSLTSWRTVTATCGASSGGRTRVSALEGRSISRYTIPA